jgi:hypothetical protein
MDGSMGGIMMPVDLAFESLCERGLALRVATGRRTGATRSHESRSERSKRPSICDLALPLCNTIPCKNGAYGPILVPSVNAK